MQLVIPSPTAHPQNRPNIDLAINSNEQLDTYIQHQVQIVQLAVRHKSGEATNTVSNTRPFPARGGRNEFNRPYLLTLSNFFPSGSTSKISNISSMIVAVPAIVFRESLPHNCMKESFDHVSLLGSLDATRLPAIGQQTCTLCLQK
jgi:hypothetical protein